MTAASTNIDLVRLFKLRLVVARHGEMDAARWWNTNGILGRRGNMVLKRGFPSTHCFAQARIAFAVARNRCQELFDPPGSMTLWNLPAEIEDQFDECWQGWLDEGDQWTPVFGKLSETEPAETEPGDLLRMLEAFDLIDRSHVEAVGKLRRAAEGRSVPLAGTHCPDDDVITLLAAGFARGEPGSPAIPYARLED
ncbi:BrxE family protein [Halochromatium sp.]